MNTLVNLDGFHKADRPTLKRSLTAQSTEVMAVRPDAHRAIPMSRRLGLLDMSRPYSTSRETLHLDTMSLKLDDRNRHLSSSSLPLRDLDDTMAKLSLSRSRSPFHEDEVSEEQTQLESEFDVFRNSDVLDNPVTHDDAEPESALQHATMVSSGPDMVQSRSIQDITSLSPPTSRLRSERKASAKAFVSDLKPKIDHRFEALPISKEKEAILACTRPTFLPPKSRKEEKKHLKEFEKLVYGSLEADRKLQKRKSKALVQKAKHLTNSADTWTNHILPHFATAVKDPRTKALWWSGLPNRIRGEVWATCVGNSLSISADTFNLALSKSEQTEELLSRRQEDEHHGDMLLTSESYELLQSSVARTFTNLRIFQNGGPLHKSLIQVLKAYLYYRQDVMVSYVEGVNYIAGLLLLYLPPIQCFITLANVLNRSLPLALYTKDEPVLNRFVAVYLARVAEVLPQLHKHLHQVLRIAPLVYLESMLNSFLARQATPDISSRIFDIYAFEGDAFLIRAVVAVLMSLEHALYGNVHDVLTVLAGEDREHTWEKNLLEDDFIRKCRTVY